MIPAGAARNGENFKLLESVAHKLNAAVGASRAAVPELDAELARLGKTGHRRLPCPASGDE